jgi:hypothetical protein
MNISNTQREINADDHPMLGTAAVLLMHYLAGLSAAFHGRGNIAQSMRLKRDCDGNINRNTGLRIFHF